ncbi:MAG: hypothetical protein WEA36_07020 [Balneolaceae bacterium]
MIRTVVTIALAGLCSLMACTSSDEHSSVERESSNIEDLGFFDRVAQPIAERVVRAQLSPKDSLMLSSDLEIYGVSHMILEDRKLYIVDGSQLRIAILDPESLQEEHAIELSEGGGPGELPHIGNFDVQGDQIMLGDRSLQRIQYRDLAGELISEASIEAYPKSMGLARDGNMIGLLSPLMANSDDVIHIVSTEGELVNSFATIQDGRNMLTDLRIHGYVSLGGNDQLYYAGYAEHLLKSWDMDGNLIFSVETIEPAPDGINYHTFENSERRGAGYSEYGVYSASGLISTGADLVVVHAGMPSFSAPDQPQYLDFYNPASRMYSHTLVLPHRTSRIAIYENTLYALHLVDDEIYLFRYAME